MYIPPFNISSDAINMIADISRLIERYAIRMEQEDALLLRKANRINPHCKGNSPQMLKLC